MSGGKVFRFDGAMRFFHWSYIVFYFILAITGSFLYFGFLGWLIPVFGGIQTARIIHLLAALGLVLVPLVTFVLKPGEVIETLRYAYSWKAGDLSFFKGFVAEFFGGHADYSLQGKYNQGEKLNIVFQSAGWFMFVLSGLVMWQFSRFSASLGGLALIVHDIAFILTFAYVIGHIYLSLLHPVTRKALSGMLNGYVDAGYAKGHHPLWYAEVEGRGKAKNGR